MKFILSLSIVLTLLLPHRTHAQNESKVDSLLQRISETKSDTLKARYYLELSDLTMYNDQNKTLLFLQKADSLYRKTTDNKGIAKLFAQKANYYYRLGQIDSARYYLVNSVNKSLAVGDTLRAAVIRHNIGILDHYQGNSESANAIMKLNIPVFEKFHDSLHLGNAFLMKGKIAMSDGYYNLALKETHTALKIHRSLGDDFRIAEDLLQLGIIYQLTKEHKKAIDIFKESIVLYTELNNDQSVAQALNFMAASNLELKNYDTARTDLEKALDISEKLGYKANIARVYTNWGKLEFDKNNFNKAIEYFKKSLVLWQAIQAPNQEADALYYIGNTLSTQKKYAESIAYLNQSIAIAEAVKDVEVLKKAYMEKSVALEGQKNFRESLYYFRKNKAISDSIFTIEQAKATQELKIIYETEKKEQQIAIQEKEINLLEKNAKISNLQRILLAIAFLLSIIAFYAIRQKLKRNKLEKEKVDSELAFKRKELTTHALNLARKNEVLEDLKQKAESLKKSGDTVIGCQQLISTINFDLQDDSNWENFSRYFEQVHKDFNSNVKKRFPELTSNELRLMSLLKMNLSSKEIANILNISQEGIKKARYRLRKKLNITSEESLQDLVLSL